MTVTAGADVPRRRVLSTTTSNGRAALVLWALVVCSGAAAALILRVTGARISIDAPPLHARLGPHIDAGVLFPLAVATLVVAFGLRAVAMLEWRPLLVASTVAASAWAVSLAALRGSHRIVEPVLARGEYFAALPGVRDIGAFIRGFVDHIAAYPVHVQGHPPGTVVLLAALRDIGLASPWWAAAVFVAGGALAVPAVLVAVRDVAGIGTARRAAPFLVLTPAAIWVATSADALYMGVGACGVALVVVATGRRDRWGDAAAFAGGVAFAAAVLGSYGLVLLAIVPVTVAVQRRRVRPLAIALSSGCVLLLGVGVMGFWWPAGLVATRGRYLAGIASRRPYVPFLFINLAAFAVALGPAVAVALARLRDRALWLLVGGGLAAVAVAELSGMSKGEVERIWLPFAPWILVAASALDPSTSARRHVRDPAVGWLSVQVASAIVLESIVRTPW